jgi:ferritin-like metal-binding protein YciE
MAETRTLHDALVDELRDLYHAEKQLVRALPKMARAAGRDELRDALENHLAETEHQLTRLEQVFEQLEERPRAKPCAGMAGIIEEGSELLKEDFPEAVMDAQIIAAAQRVEHYEMAAYGQSPPGPISWARRGRRAAPRDARRREADRLAADVAGRGRIERRGDGWLRSR